MKTLTSPVFLCVVISFYIITYGGIMKALITQWLLLASFEGTMYDAGLKTAYGALPHLINGNNGLLMKWH
jgi:hypothetical protein